MADLTIQDVVMTGLSPTLAAGASTATIPIAPGERIALRVANGGGGSINVTITAEDTPQIVKGFGSKTMTDAVIAVPAGEERDIGPIPYGYVDVATGKASVALSGTTSVTWAAIRYPEPA